MRPTRTPPTTLTTPPKLPRTGRNRGAPRSRSGNTTGLLPVLLTPTMTATVRVAVPRKGRPLEAVLERLATNAGIDEVADEISSTLRYEKSVTKGRAEPDRDVYERL